MKKNLEVNIHHLTRVEGHGNINIRIRGGRVEQALWEVVESPRFFEPILVGKSWENAPVITSRICGICSIGHTLASIRAIEQAFGYQPPKQTRQLRLLLKHMETLQSHILHIFFLAAPDFLDCNSILPLSSTRPEVVDLATRLKKLANDGADLIGGRRLHPTRAVAGGFTMLPTKEAVETLLRRLELALRDLMTAADIVASFSFPDFQRETEYVSLQGEYDYPFIGGSLISSDGMRKKEEQYLEMTNEYQVRQSTSRWSRLSRASFAVGALARLNNNGRFLHPLAGKLAKRLNLLPTCSNPFLNTAAQLVECIHVVEDSRIIIDRLLGQPWQTPRVQIEAREARGVGAVEVPRGILYHMYAFDAHGRITKADCVIPTSQNHGNIQLDLEQLAADSARAGLADKVIEKLASMLIRAYDPCISCSVH
ncbi:Ni/Fe hydrogenase subunit alpha [Desulfopila sp. IMCC35008]|uniref:Ni/Fe hydrogenase subunit alpha n=1 Tax=Desulfopila sp. IMCC35008 TaxID=2653858 RepID=UPI0013D245FB|nr:Ni/Fe hydrogenase subunit alpha [Desulfopila sp. IMCC35008]